MTIHTVRLDTITTIEQHRRVITITTERRHLTIMAIAIRLTISIAPIAINRSDHLRRRVIMGHLIMDHLIVVPLIMGHPISIARLLTEVVDKKCNEI